MNCMWSALSFQKFEEEFSLLGIHMLQNLHMFYIYWFSIIHILTQLLALTLYATNIDSVKLEQTFKILISIDVLTSSTLYKSPKCRPYVTDTSYWAISLDWFSIWILLSISLFIWFCMCFYLFSLNPVYLLNTGHVNENRLYQECLQSNSWLDLSMWSDERGLPYLKRFIYKI